MLIHVQSNFFVQYFDPDSRTVGSHYPDFIFQREESDGSLKYVIVEVKADAQIENAVLQAKKDFAHRSRWPVVWSATSRSSPADERHYRMLL